MKIAVNTRFLLPGRLEGLGWYTHEIVRRMVLAHPEDEFLFLFDRPFSDEFIYAENVRPVVLFPPARHPILWHWWFEWSVARCLKKERPDVFFSPDSYLSLSAKTPTVMTVHDLVPLHFPEQIPLKHRHYFLRQWPKFIRRADHIVTISNFVAQDIVQTCGIAGDRVTVAYNGCRENFKPISDLEKSAIMAQYADGKPYFLYTGAIHPRKNIPRLIQGFDQFVDRTGADVRLLLAGRFAWKTGEVTEAYENARNKHAIRFLGYVPEAVLPALTASAQAFAYLSLSEGFGLPMLESMHCDVPVLAANASCLPEIAGDAALLVNPLDVSAIAEGLNLLHSDVALRSQLIEKGRIQREKFSWDQAAAQIYATLTKTAGK
ncbi:MAG: glycosyltransferase family 4 protein [Saprospiraceae bacterium]|nr:glycosyltransferase family 4 protein [Saprospiraceae bacterium]